LTGTNTNASAISVASNNRLHMHAANDGGAFRDWIYDGTPGQWTPV